jgi:hypothetical protein
MALGVVLDAIAVRSLLVPCGRRVALFGRLGMWPGNPPCPPEPARGRGKPPPVPGGDQP